MARTTPNRIYPITRITFRFIDEMKRKVIMAEATLTSAFRLPQIGERVNFVAPIPDDYPGRPGLPGDPITFVVVDILHLYEHSETQIIIEFPKKDK